MESFSLTLSGDISINIPSHIQMDTDATSLFRAVQKCSDARPPSH
jgi:hypothetical protein